VVVWEETPCHPETSVGLAYATYECLSKPSGCRCGVIVKNGCQQQLVFTRSGTPAQNHNGNQEANNGFCGQNVAGHSHRVRGNEARWGNRRSPAANQCSTWQRGGGLATVNVEGSRQQPPDTVVRRPQAVGGVCGSGAAVPAGGQRCVVVEVAMVPNRRRCVA